MIKRDILKVLLASCVLSSPAYAVDKQVKEPVASSWWDKTTVYGLVNVGGSFNTEDNLDKMNFGRLTDDQDGPSLHQFQMNVSKPIDTSLKDYDYGFKLQAIYGSDARISRAINFLEETAGYNRHQVDITEAHALIHTPWFTDGGFDLRIGKYYDMESAETMDPAGNFFYSHSYIFNFGDPFNHTGVFGVLHATPWLDVGLGVSTGVNTTLFAGDNNDSLSYEGYLAFNFGEFTTQLTSHIGPEVAELATRNGTLPATVDADDSFRALNTLTSIWKVTDRWTLMNDLNWIYDDSLNSGKKAEGYGVAQYATYKINDLLAVGVRGEVWRDVEGVYVCQFAGNYDFIRAQKGQPARNGRSVCGGKTTYGMLTFGMNITPDVGPSKFVKGLVFRPEIRYDSSLNDKRAFNDGRDEDQLTIGGDVILKF